MIAAGLQGDSTAGTSLALARSHIYRALSRALMLACIVNHRVDGGLLQWLEHVELKGDFDRQAELDKRDQRAVQRVEKKVSEMAVSQAAAHKRGVSYFSRLFLRKRPEQSIRASNHAVTNKIQAEWRRREEEKGEADEEGVGVGVGGG